MRKTMYKKVIGTMTMCMLLFGATIGVSAANTDSFIKHINANHGNMIGIIALVGGENTKGVAASTSVTGKGNNVYVTLEVQRNSTGKTIYKNSKSDSKNAQISTGLNYNYRIGAFSAHEIRSSDGSWGAYLRLVEK